MPPQLPRRPRRREAPREGGTTQDPAEDRSGRGSGREGEGERPAEEQSGKYWKRGNRRRDGRDVPLDRRPAHREEGT